MSKDCLLLNADAQVLSLIPLSTLSWQEAVKMKYEGSVEVVAEYDYECHSPSITWRVPSVVMLKSYKKVARAVKFSRYNVFLRDGFECQYCGVDMKNSPNLLTLDHVLPKKLGGKTRWDNVVTACPKCNSEKGHELVMKPKTKAYKPDIWELQTKRRKMPIFVPHISWIDFLQWHPSLVIMLD